MKAMKYIALLITALLLSACVEGGQDIEGAGTLRYVHDTEHHVGCWYLDHYPVGLQCLPDKEYQP